MLCLVATSTWDWFSTAASQPEIPQTGWFPDQLALDTLPRMPNPFSLRTIPLLAAASVLLVTSACGSEGADSGETAPTTSATSATPAPASTPAESPAATDAPAPGEPSHADPAARAAQGALAAVAGDVISIDRERGSTWSVLVRGTNGSGTEVYVDATNGTVSRKRSEQLPAVARSAAPTFTAVEAIDVALKAQPSGAVHELDLDRDRGRVVWEIEVRGGGGNTEFYIDASTGEIVKQERA